jgi:alkylation response protein AidB-like acyl-CoA dehydrogenase
MDFEFPADTLMLRDMLRRFLQKEARPLEMDYFNSGALKPEQRAKLRRAIEQLGLWGHLAPEEFGGAGLDTVTACLIEEELGSTFIPLEMGEVPAMLYACQGDQIGEFLEPALEGSRRAIIAAREPAPASLLPETWSTITQPAGEEYLLNGRKILSTRPEAGDFFIVLARSSPQGKNTDLTAFLLDSGTPGLTVSLNGGVYLDLQDCTVERASLLGEPGGALKLATDEAPRAWIRMGARYVGMVERLTEMACEHARDWVSLGEALSVRPAIQRILADLRVQVESTRWLVYHTAWLADTQPPEKLRLPAAQVRLASGELLKHAVDSTTMVFLGPGPSAQIEPRRLVQSVIPMDALEQGLEQARAVIAKQMLNLSQT